MARDAADQPEVGQSPPVSRLEQTENSVIIEGNAPGRTGSPNVGVALHQCFTEPYQVVWRKIGFALHISIHKTKNNENMGKITY